MVNSPADQYPSFLTFITQDPMICRECRPKYTSPIFTVNVRFFCKQKFALSRIWIQRMIQSYSKNSMYWGLREPKNNQAKSQLIKGFPSPVFAQEETWQLLFSCCFRKRWSSGLGVAPWGEGGTVRMRKTGTDPGEVNFRIAQCYQYHVC